MKLRPYQKNAINSIERGWNDFSKQIAVIPTGGGKTIVFSHLADRQEGRTLILAHREELIDQAIAKLHSATGIIAGKEKAAFRASHHHSVVVASVQSMVRRLDKWPENHFSQVVVDECHRTLSKTYLKVLNHFDGFANVLGVTATPDRGDKRNLGEYYENIAYELSMLDLIKDGFLAPIKIKTVPIKLDVRGVAQKAGDYDANDLDEVLTPYFEEIVRAIKEHAPFRRTVAFLPLVATSKKFVQVCNDLGLSAAHVDGSSPDRKQILERFARNEFELLSNSMLLAEGYDDPGIECIVNMSPTRSRALYAQRIGRGTRIHPGKSNLLLLDFLWQHEKHNLIRPAHLISETDEVAEIMTQISEKTGGQMEMDLEGLASEAQVQREKRLRELIKEREHEEGQLMDAMEFCLQMGDVDAADYEDTMPWHKDKMSSKQAAILKKAGVNLNTIRSKGHASKLLDLYFKHQNLQLASPKQRAAMKRAGVPNADQATKADAKKFFSERNRAA